MIITEKVEYLNNSFFQTPGHTVPQPVFTRNSVAYLSNGTQVPVNQPRFEDGAFGKGILIEEGSTNLLLYSEDFTQSIWEKTNINVTQVPSYLNYVTTRITPNNPGNISLVAQRFLSSGAANRTFTWSFYARGQTNRVFKVNFYGGISGTFIAYEINLTTEWKKFSITHTFPSNATTARIQLGNVSPYWGIDYTDWIEIAGIQVEEKPYATSYIKTTTSTVSRSFENFSIPTTNILDPNEGTIEFKLKPSIITNYNNYFNMSTSNGRFLLFFFNDGKAIFDYGASNSGIVTPVNTVTAGQMHTIALRWSATSNKQALFVNGIKYEQNLPNGVATSFPDIVSVVNNFSALADELRISNIARSDAEILAAYNSNQPLPITPDTTYKLDFDNNITAQYNLIDMLRQRSDAAMFSSISDATLQYKLVYHIPAEVMMRSDTDLYPLNSNIYYVGRANMYAEITLNSKYGYIAWVKSGINSTDWVNPVINYTEWRS